MAVNRCNRFAVTLWSGVGVLASAAATTPAIDCRGWTSIDGVLFQATSVAGAAGFKLEVQWSMDGGLTWTAAVNTTAVIADSRTVFSSGQELAGTVAGPVIRGTHVRFVATELTGTVADSLITASLLVREG